MFYRFAKLVVGSLLAVIWGPRILGAENIPERGAVILASNHLAGADTVVMPCLVERQVHFLAKADLLTGRSAFGRVLARILTSLGVMPIERTGGSISQAAIDTGLAVLADQRVLGIYPEGSRSPDGRLYRGKTGVARLALAAGCPVVPIAMSGTFAAQRGRKVLPRRHPRMDVLVGPAIDPTAVVAGLEPGASEGEVYRAVTDAVMAAIRELSGQEHGAGYAADEKRRLSALGPQKGSHTRRRG